MAKFNSKKTAPKSTTHEGALLYDKTLDTEWCNALCSSFLANQYYETATEQQDRFVDLTRKMVDSRGISFVATAAVFARTDLGMRSISTLVAAILNDYQLKGKRGFYARYFSRPDDVAETFAAIKALGSKPSHGLVRGACDYLSGLNAYQLGKYKLAGHDYNMYDLINVTHATSEAIDAYKHGNLDAPDTWETAVSAAADEDGRKAEWIRLVRENKLGYLALIRNLRNIMGALDGNPEADDTIINHLVPQLTNKVAIAKSRVFPYQIYGAYLALKDARTCPVLIEGALSVAFKASCGVMTQFDGSTALVLDVSGSMDDSVSDKSSMSIKQLCACYCAAIYVSNPDSEFVKFGTRYAAESFNRLGNVFDIIDGMCANDNLGYGTDIAPVFKGLDRHYDRIFLFSDMQVMNRGWHESPVDALHDYYKRCGESRIYSFDCGNYHQVVDNPNSSRFFQFTALSAQVFNFITAFEEGWDNLADYIADVVQPVLPD